MSMESKPSFRPYKKHIMVCTGPRCAPDQAPAVYQHLKDRIKELGYNEGPDRIQRTQAHCFGICQRGPLAVVYPEGVWYYGVSKEKMERILQEHLLNDKPVTECILHRKTT